ncbi:TolC family protein [Desulfosediminicola flagellatus]|uniref:TolC family protein n=1 Tax=Desulfosediminicola flagellatus TaxID=2569541 RepID=UPI0010AC6BFD|nr:TolC family protein [Desulfosediminicola flagellatus]
MDRRLLPKDVHILHFFITSALHTLTAVMLVVWVSTAGSATETSFSSEEEKVIEEFTASDSTVRMPEIIAVYEKLFFLAYQQAPEILVARSLKQQKQHELYTAQARRYSPSLQGALSQVHELHYEAPEIDPDNFQDGRDHTDWGLSMNLPIYNKPLGVALDVAKAEEKLAVNTLLIQTQQLDLRLKELLGGYLESTYRLFNIRNSVKISSGHVQKINKGYELRDQTKLQLLRAQANLKDLETRRDLDEQAQEVTFRELLDFTGISNENPVFAQLDGLLQNEMDIAGCINSLAALDEQYPEIEHQVEFAEMLELYEFFQENSVLFEGIVLTKMLADNQSLLFTQDEWFDIAVSAQYDRREDTELEKLDGEGTLALVLSVPLFSGGTSFSNVKTKAMARKVADITKNTELRTRFHAILNTRKLIISLQKVLQTQQVNLKQQKEIVTLSLKSYQIKQTSMQDLLTSQNNLIDAKNALMQTTTQLGIAVRQFAWELGRPFPIPELPKND